MVRHSALWEMRQHQSKIYVELFSHCTIGKLESKLSYGKLDQMIPLTIETNYFNEPVNDLLTQLTSQFLTIDQKIIYRVSSEIFQFYCYKFSG